MTKFTTTKANTLVDHLKKMFPQQANLDVATQNFQDKEFRSLAIVKKVDGKWERDLFIGTWGHTSAEAPKESLLFIMMQAVAKAQGDPAPSKQAFDSGLQTAWQATQTLMKATDASNQGST